MQGQRLSGSATEEGEYLDDLNSPYYRGQENEIIILRCNVSEIHSNVMVSVQKQNMSIQYHPMVSLKDDILQQKPTAMILHIL